MINTQGDNNGPSPDLEHNSTGPQGGQQAGKYAALYRGEITRKKTLAQRLVELLRDGKEIQKTERTRWQRNRLMYRGEQYLRVVINSVRTLAPSDKLPNGRRRDTVNMIKPFVDGRVATITYQRPPFKVLPNSNEQDARDAARLATNFLKAMWDVNGWDLDRKFRELNITAEIDGVSFLNVYYDRFGGDYKSFDVATDPSGKTCQLACELEANCRAWSYVRPGYLGQSAVCYLKNQITLPRRKPCCIAGVVR